jgi:hypothetical protein
MSPWIQTLGGTGDDGGGGDDGGNGQAQMHKRRRELPVGAALHDQPALLAIQ